MSRLWPLFLPVLCALGGFAKPVYDAPPYAVHGVPARRGESQPRQRRFYPDIIAVDDEIDDPFHALPRRFYPDVIAVDGGTNDTFHARPRSLPTSDAPSITQPLLIGVIIGIVATLFAFGFIYVVRRVYRRRQEPTPPRLPLHIRTRAPAPFKSHHLDHFPMSRPDTPSPTNSSASTLRVAHRRPDGSWAFAEAPDDCDLASTGPDPTRPPPTPLWRSPTSACDSGSAFSELHGFDRGLVYDGSSAKTGPPPYLSQYMPYSSPPPPDEKRGGPASNGA